MFNSKVNERIYKLEVIVDDLKINNNKLIKIVDDLSLQVINDKKAYIQGIEILNNKVNCKHSKNNRTFEILYSCIGNDYRELCSHCGILIKDYKNEVDYKEAELAYIKLKNKEKENCVSSDLKALKYKDKL